MAKSSRKAVNPAKPEGKYKLTISLDPQLARRFAAYCGLVGRDQSEVATEAFTRQLVGFKAGIWTTRGAVPEGGSAAEPPSRDLDAAEPEAAAAPGTLRVAG